MIRTDRVVKMRALADDGSIVSDELRQDLRVLMERHGYLGYVISMVAEGRGDDTVSLTVCVDSVDSPMIGLVVREVADMYEKALDEGIKPE